METAAYAPESYARITADEGFSGDDLSEVWRYRDLVWLFVKRGFTVQYKQTILGPLWVVLQPLATSIVWLFVFGGIAQIGTDGVPGILFYLGGNALWSHFSFCTSSNSRTFTDNAYLFGKVYFPRLVMPVANMISSIITFGIRMLVFVPLYLWFFVHGEVGGTLLAIPGTIGLLVLLGAMGIGFGIIFSSFTVKYRDLNVLVGFGMSLWTYATPVVYPLTTITDPMLRIVMQLNPVTAPVELFRSVMFGTGTVEMWAIAYSVIFTLVILAFGIRRFAKVERTFIDTV